MSAEKDRKGFVLVMVALVLVVLLGFVALAVDVGVAYGGRTEAQAAADAAALAGAFAFVVDSKATDSDVRDRAIAAANVNEIMGEPVAITAADVDVDMTARRVTVRVNHDMSTFFARVLGISSMDIGVVAVAEASKTPTGAYCLKPFIVPGTALNPIDPCEACKNGQVLLDIDGKRTAYAESMLGTQFLVKPQNPSGAWAPSHFMPVEISGSGAEVYRDDIAGCTGVVVRCGDLLNAQTGNMSGPTRQGIEGGGQVEDGGLIGDPPDQYNDIADYGTNHTDVSRSLVVAPIWNSCQDPNFIPGETGECPAESVPSGGNAQFTVGGFVLIFIEGVQNVGGENGVAGRLIDVFGCEAGTGSITEPGPYSLPVRLIRP
jgi:Flp pilus assembly protein TadG